MTRVTGKFQITLPRRLVDAYGIRVGDQVELIAAGQSIALIPERSRHPGLSSEERIRLFDETSRWLSARTVPVTYGPQEDRGWQREDLYTRGRPR